MSLRRPDHSSRVVLSTVVHLCVWSRNLVNEEAMAHWGLLRQKKKRKKKEKTKKKRIHLYYNITLNISTCFDPQVTILRELNQNKKHEKNLVTFIHIWSFDSFTQCQLCIKMANLGLCHIDFVSFPDNGPLRIETWRNIQCDITIQISKDKFCAFSWFIVVNLSLGK